MTPWSSASRTRIIVRGSSISIVVPSPGADCTASVPPGLRDDLAEQRQPEMALLPAPLARLLGEALAVVGDDEPRRALRRARDRDAHRRRLGVLARVADRLARGAVDERVDRRRPRPRRPRATSRCRQPRAGSAGRDSATRRPADSRFGGWISTSSVRRSRTPWRSVPVAPRRTFASSSSPRRSASAVSGARPKATPARSCTTPSCRSAAIRWRSRVDASTALASSASRSRCPRCRRRAIDQRERHLQAARPR